MCFASVNGSNEDTFIAIPFDGIATLVSIGTNNKWSVILKKEYQNENIKNIVIANEHYNESGIIDDFGIEELGSK